MLTQPTTKPVQWQDLQVLSEADLVLNIAQQNGWKDCEKSRKFACDYQVDMDYRESVDQYRMWFDPNYNWN